MSPNRRFLFASAILAAFVAGILGCSSNSSHVNNAGGSANFDTVVVIGDSLSAGFQNGSLLDTQQPHGWASLVATQAKFNLTLPLVAPPGAPAVLELESLGPPPVTIQASGTTTGRDNPNAQPYDIAVPGHLLNDLINRTQILVPQTPEDLITDAVLAEPLSVPHTQLSEAIFLKPTTLFVWIGSNDALVADIAGTPAVMTPVSTFTTEYQQLMTTLKAKTKATLIVANIPDVTEVPYLTPASAIIAQISAATSLPQAEVSLLLGIQPGDLVNTTGLAQVQAAVAALEHGQLPTPLTDAAFLSVAEIAQVQATVDQYNAVIAQQVSSVGGILVDIHSALQGLAQTGITINNYPATTSFLGGLFGLDGIHPTNTGYALIANIYIQTINAALKTNIAQVDVSSVASSDPLFGPNIKPIGAVATIPLRAARRADQVIMPHLYASSGTR